MEPQCGSDGEALGTGAGGGNQVTPAREGILSRQEGDWIGYVFSSRPHPREAAASPLVPVQLVSFPELLWWLLSASHCDPSVT